MLKAVFFDMDGTITRPCIDWKALRQRVGVPEGMPIMAYIESLAPPARQQAEAILETAETQAAEAAELNPGAAELIRDLRALLLRLALITNNHRRAMQQVVARFGLRFDLLLSREDAPLKPAPDLLLLALERLGLEPGNACFVGDGRYDQLASEAAGIRYIHLANDSRPADGAPTIYALSELWRHLAPGAGRS
jgi:HAD superfamily hydrolase (TIGR01509 family)